MTGLSSAVWMTGSYIVAGLFFYFIMNFMTKGFITQYLKVKLSRGKLILVKAYDVTDTFYVAGKINSKRNLIVKDRAKQIHTFNGLTNAMISRELGMNYVEVDLVKGLIIKKDFTGIKGFDLTMVDELVNRALMLPRLNKDEIWEKAEKLILIIILIGVGIAVYLLLTQHGVTCPKPATGVNI